MTTTEKDQKSSGANCSEGQSNCRCVNTFRTIDEDEFGRIGERWDSLLIKSQNKNIFLSWEWLHTWWQHFKDANKILCVLIAEDLDKTPPSLNAVFPLFIDRKGSAGIAKTVRFLGSDKVGSDYLDFILSPGMEEDLIREGLGYLSTTCNGISKMAFSDMNTESQNYPLLSIILEDLKFPVLETPANVCPYLVLPDNIDSFYGNFSKNFRWQLRRRYRAFEEEFAVTLKAVETQEEIGPAVDKLFELHRLRREQLLDTGAFDNPTSVRFHKDVSRLFFMKGWLRLYSLEANGISAASLYCFEFGGKYSYYQGGFHPDYARLHAGQVILGRCAEDALLRGNVEFDFLRGDEAYKGTWTKRKRMTHHITAFPNSKLGKLHFHCSRIERFVYSTAKKLVRNSRSHQGWSLHIRKLGTSISEKYLKFLGSW